MLDLKAFKLSNAVTMMGIYIALLLMVPVQIKQFTAGSSRIFYFRANVSGYEQALDEEGIEAWLNELRTIRQGDHVLHFELQEEDEQNLISDESFASVEDEFLRDEIESTSEYLQGGQLFCYMEGSVALTEEQQQLSRICSDFGMTLEMSDPAGKKQSDAAKAKEKFYNIMFMLAAACSAIVLFVVEFFWFQCRKKEWHVRQLFCISRSSLIKEIVLLQVLLLLIALLAALASMAFVYHFGIWQMMKKAVMVMIAIFILMLFFCCSISDV